MKPIARYIAGIWHRAVVTPYRRWLAPTIASTYQSSWNYERRVRQHQPFIVPRADLFEHAGAWPVERT